MTKSLIKQRRPNRRAFAKRLENKQIVGGNRPYYVDKDGKPRRRVKGSLKCFLVATAHWPEPIFREPSRFEILVKAWISREFRGLTAEEMDEAVAYDFVVARGYKFCNVGWFYSGPDEEQPSYYHVTIYFYRRKRQRAA